MTFLAYTPSQKAKARTERLAALWGECAEDSDFLRAVQRDKAQVDRTRRRLEP